MKEPILTHFPLSDHVTAFSTTRQGGWSEGDHASFNVNPFCGDNPSHVRQNTEALCRKLGVKPRDLVMPHQVHGAKVVQVDTDLLRLSDDGRREALEGVDALITDVRKVCIAVSTADCIPVLLYDAEHHAGAAVHAGWRGTVACIVQATVEQMTTAYGTRPEGLRAAIGPGISLAAFEVGDEVYDAFRQAGFPMERIARKPQKKWHLDLPLANQLILEGLGVQPERIFRSDICTFTDHRHYFSARRLGIQSGRICTGLILR